MDEHWMQVMVFVLAALAVGTLITLGSRLLRPQSDRLSARSPEPPLPRWGEQARRLTKSAWNVFSTLWLLGFAITGIGALMGADSEDLQEVFRDSLPWALLGWPLVISYAVSLLLVVVGGIGWIAGSVAAGFNEPQAD